MVTEYKWSQDMFHCIVFLSAKDKLTNSKVTFTIADLQWGRILFTSNRLTITPTSINISTLEKSMLKAMYVK